MAGGEPERALAGVGQAWEPAQARVGITCCTRISRRLPGAIAMPGTEPGILAPYQERPKNWPLQLILHYDPRRDGSRYFPLLMAAGDTEANASTAHLASELERLNQQARVLYEETAAYYEHFFDRRLTAETPDARVNQALKWAEVSIDQLRVQHGAEVGLVAGAL